MSFWRFGKNWPPGYLSEALADLARRRVNFDAPFEAMTRESGWTIDGSLATVGCERPGEPEPDGVFETAKRKLVSYEFSDPAIVVGHFDPTSPLVGRNMLLEIKVWGFRFLNGVRVHSVQDQREKDATVFGFRYDTLEGHIERGAEWFVLRKNHVTGEVAFLIEARWRLGTFPNWWTKLGFRWLSPYYRHLWRKRAPGRLALSTVVAELPAGSDPVVPAKEKAWVRA